MPSQFSLPTSCVLVLALTGYVAAYVSGSSENYLPGATRARQAANDEQEVSAMNTIMESEAVQAKDPQPFPVAGLPLPPGYSIPSASGLVPTTNFAAGNGLPNFQLPGYPPYFPQGFGVLPGPNYPGAYPIQGQGFPPPGQGFPPPGQGFPAPGQGFPPPGQGFPAPGQGFPPPGQGLGGFPGPVPEPGFPTPTNGAYQGFPIPAQGGYPGQAFASSGGGQAFATSSGGGAGGPQGIPPPQGPLGPGFLATTIPGQGLPPGGEGFPYPQGFPIPAGFPGQPFPQGLPPQGGYFPGQFDTTVASDEPVADTSASASISFDEQPHDTVYGTKGGYVYEKP